MTINQAEWTVGRLLNWTAEYFKTKGLDEPMLSAQLLLAKVLGCSKMDLYLRFEQAVDQGPRDEYRALVKRAAECEPIAYLVGHKEFFSLDFLVNRSVLIPRPETELLVQWVIRKVRADHPGELDILDLGTGSGCIAVALAKLLPRPARIVAIDKSPDALGVARTNAERHKVQDSITFKTGNLFGPLESQGRFHFIVANPPYVTEEDYGRLPKSIKDYEPADALVSGPDGLAVIRTIILEAPDFLNSGGYLVMEIGYNQADAVSKLLAEHGYTEIALERDAAGIPRIAIGKK